MSLFYQAPPSVTGILRLRRCGLTLWMKVGLRSRCNAGPRDDRRRVNSLLGNTVSGQLQ